MNSSTDSLREDESTEDPAKKPELNFQEDNVKISLEKLYGRSRLAQALWLSILVATIIGFSYHFAELIKVYLTYPLTTSLSEAAVPFTFPDVTLCHPLPFIGKKHDPRSSQNALFPGTQLRFYEDFYGKHLREFWRLALFDKIPLAQLTFDQKDILAEAMDASFMNYTVRHAFLPAPEDIVVICFYDSRRCQWANFTIIASLTMGYCFRFQPFDEYFFKRDSKHGLLFHTYINNWLPGAKVGDIMTNEEGISTFIHPRNAFPRFEVPNNLLQVNQRIYLRLKMQAKRRIVTPIKSCTRPELLSRCHFGRAAELVCTGFLNDIETCAHDQWQYSLKQACGCLAHDWLIPPELANSGLPSCYQIPDLVFENQGVFGTAAASTAYIRPIGGNESISLVSLTDMKIIRERFLCYRNFRSSYRAENATDGPECQPLCEEKSYEVTSYRMKHDSVDTDQLNDETKGQLTGMLRELNAAGWDNSTLAGHVRDTGAGSLFSYSNLVFDTSGSLNVFSTDFFSSLETEDLLYPLKDLFSDIGATLGIWLGCCVVTVFEIAELLHAFSVIYLKRREREAEG